MRASRNASSTASDQISSFCIELIELDGANWFIVWVTGMLVILEKRVTSDVEMLAGVVKRKSRLEIVERER